MITKPKLNLPKIKKVAVVCERQHRQIGNWVRLSRIYLALLPVNATGNPIYPSMFRADCKDQQWYRIADNTRATDRFPRRVGKFMAAAKKYNEGGASWDAVVAELDEEMDAM